MKTKTLTVLTAAVLSAAMVVMLASGGGASQGDTIMTTLARGSFDVTIEPATQEELSDGTSLGRLSLAKKFHGDLEASGKGEMLTATTAVEGSAGYVAMERVDGTLHGRQGSFVLQHVGTMARGEQHLTVTVVPDSGTGELEGLEGTLDITIDDDGNHFYELDYTLADATKGR